MKKPIDKKCEGCGTKVSKNAKICRACYQKLRLKNSNGTTQICQNPSCKKKYIKRKKGGIFCSDACGTIATKLTGNQKVTDRKIRNKFLKRGKISMTGNQGAFG